MNILLETERLTLRRFTAADADHLHGLENDPLVMRYINGGVPVDRATIVTRRLPTFMAYAADRPIFGFWAADERAVGRFAGWFSLRPLPDDARTATLGFRLRRTVWGRGLATEGAAALIAVAFRSAAVNRIVATTYEANLGSQRVLEKLGFRLVRRYRPTPAELATDTATTDSGDAWEGDDLLYALDGERGVGRAPRPARGEKEG